MLEFTTKNKVTKSSTLLTINDRQIACLVLEGIDHESPVVGPTALRIIFNGGSVLIVNSNDTNVEKILELHKLLVDKMRLNPETLANDFLAKVQKPLLTYKLDDHGINHDQQVTCASEPIAESLDILFGDAAKDISDTAKAINNIQGKLDAHLATRKEERS